MDERLVRRGTVSSIGELCRAILESLIVSDEGGNECRDRPRGADGPDKFMRGRVEVPRVILGQGWGGEGHLGGFPAPKAALGVHCDFVGVEQPSEHVGLATNIADQFGVGIFSDELAVADRLHIGPPLQRARLGALDFPQLRASLQEAGIAVAFKGQQLQVERLFTPKCADIAVCYLGVVQGESSGPSFLVRLAGLSDTMRFVMSQPDDVDPILVALRLHEILHHADLEFRRAEASDGVGRVALAGNQIGERLTVATGRVETDFLEAVSQWNDVSRVVLYAPSAPFQPTDFDVPMARAIVNKAERLFPLFAGVRKGHMYVARQHPAVRLQDAPEHVAAGPAARERDQRRAFDEERVGHRSPLLPSEPSQEGGDEDEGCKAVVTDGQFHAAPPRARLATSPASAIVRLSIPARRKEECPTPQTLRTCRGAAKRLHSNSPSSFCSMDMKRALKATCSTCTKSVGSRSTAFAKLRDSFPYDFELLARIVGIASGDERQKLFRVGNASTGQLETFERNGLLVVIAHTEFLS